MRVWSAICSCESQKPNRSSYLIVFTPFRIVLQKTFTAIKSIITYLHLYFFFLSKVINNYKIDLYFFLIKWTLSSGLCLIR